MTEFGGDLSTDAVPEQVYRPAGDECREALVWLQRQLGGGRPVILFVGNDGYFITGQRYNPTDLRIVLLPRDKGLVAAALRDQHMWIYPNHVDSERHYEPVVKGVKLEIAAPIFFQGKPSAGLLIDFISDHQIPVIDDKFLTLIRKFCDDISGIFTRYQYKIQDEGEPEYGAQLRALVEDCRKHTDSLRGYVAIKKWDGKLAYFTRPTDQDRFLQLNQNSGLCGRVFREGLEIIADDVRNHSDYVESDWRVKSEAIFPIRLRVDEDSEVVAVFNMESEHPSYYKEDSADGRRRVSEMRRILAQLRDPVMSYRRAIKPAADRISVVTTDLIEMLIGIPDADVPATFHGALEYISNLIRAKLAESLAAADSWVWIDGSEAPRPYLADSQHRGGPEEKIQDLGDGQKAVYVAICYCGRAMARLGLTVASKDCEAALNLLLQVCRIGERLIENRVERYKSTLFEVMVNRCVANDLDSVALYRLVREMRDYLEADHCSLFSCTEVGDEVGEYVTDVLVAVASTSSSMFDTSTEALYYTINPGEGLTGYIGATKESLIIPGTSDFEGELERRKIKWKKKMAEATNRPISAFVGMPILGLDKKELLGVVRLDRTGGQERPHDRSREGSRGAFREDRIEGLKTIVRLLGIAASESGLLIT
jgi:hypothetical protein